jgi:threonine 3-dehydrogenase
MYGILKVFAELLGIYYQRKFGVDFRCIRFPALLGPGVKTPGVGQYNPWAIEAAVRNKPFEIWVPEDTVLPMLYIKDAGRALVQLYDVPEEKLATRTYNSGQISPLPTAGDLVAEIKRHYPDARITFKPDPALMPILGSLPRNFGGEEAESEWGWRPAYSLEETVKDFIEEFKKMERD